MTFSPQHILVPVAIEPEDDEVLAHFAVDVACDIARGSKGKITLLSVAQATFPAAGTGLDISGKIYHTMAMVLQSRLSRGQSRLQELKERATQQGAEVDTRILESPSSIALAICETAKELGNDLIVIGSHGRKGIKRLLLGSTSERVVHLSPVPVLLLHQQRGPA